MSKCECKNCVHKEVCRIRTYPSQYGLTGDGCSEYKDKSLFVELPWKVGHTVYVDSRTLPTDKISLFEMGLCDDEMPKFFEGKVISIKQNCKGWSVKIGITTYWLYQYFDWECGEDVGTKFARKEFTYPKGAFGKTVFLDRAEAKLKEMGESK